MSRWRTGQQALDRALQDEIDEILGDIYKWQQFELVIDTSKIMQTNKARLLIPGKTKVVSERRSKS